MKKTVELTEKQIEALLWAIQLTEDSYAGFTSADKGAETCRELATLSRAETTLLQAIDLANISK
jgi:hypothetical protein